MSEIKVNSVVNSTGDNDSGFDLSTNDVIVVKTANTERMRVLADGKVGISTTSPAINLEVSGDMAVSDTTTATKRLQLSGGASEHTINSANYGSDMMDLNIQAENTIFKNGLVGVAETMRITSDAHVLIGTTTDGTTANGTVIRDGGEVLITRTDAQPLLVNRAGNAGAIIELRNANSAVGTVGGSSSRLHIASNGNSGIRFRDDLNCFTPCNADGSNSDNDQNVGQASVRFGTIFATSSSINTSDKNEKQDIEELNDAEKKVAVVAKGLLRKYRWKDAVALKGDKARIHFGIMAQDLEDAFTAEGLDASRYGMFCSDTWWELDGEIYKTKEEAPKGATEKTRLGVRYSELLAFIISAL